MRSLFVGLALLFAAALPLTASADPVDYFTLTGNGNTFTWSLPANETYPDLPHLGLLDFLTTVTNGTSTSEDVGFYTVYGPTGPTLFVPGIADELYGQIVAQISDGPPGEVDVTFDLGTFDLDDYHFGPTNPPGQPPPPPTPYTLLITQQDADATPQPSALVLLVTALFGAIPFVRRRHLAGVSQDTATELPSAGII